MDIEKKVNEILLNCLMDISNITITFEEIEKDDKSFIDQIKEFDEITFSVIKRLSIRKISELLEVLRQEDIKTMDIKYELVYSFYVLVLQKLKDI